MGRSNPNVDFVEGWIDDWTAGFVRQSNGALDVASYRKEIVQLVPRSARDREEAVALGINRQTPNSLEFANGFVQHDGLQQLARVCVCHDDAG